MGSGERSSNQYCADNGLNTGYSSSSRGAPWAGPADRSRRSPHASLNMSRAGRGPRPPWEVLAVGCHVSDGAARFKVTCAASSRLDGGKEKTSGGKGAWRAALSPIFDGKQPLHVQPLLPAGVNRRARARRHYASRSESCNPVHITVYPMVTRGWSTARSPAPAFYRLYTVLEDLLSAHYESESPFGLRKGRVRRDRSRNTAVHRPQHAPLAPPAVDRLVQTAPANEFSAGEMSEGGGREGGEREGGVGQRSQRCAGPSSAQELRSYEADLKFLRRMASWRRLRSLAPATVTRLPNATAPHCRTVYRKQKRAELLCIKAKAGNGSPQSSRSPTLYITGAGARSLHRPGHPIQPPPLPPARRACVAACVWA
ncbi:hypothetical protein SKAU_G00068770 [Synaphobranchus kaupii]|uniref:Uncharacterized protein n=1 Tax=Synaphobranchus kaupii TaxID=118154 RepID=A0A9Q1G6D5_SYNKA|nr:hypothetical protein SKAU_G00068770 [Synaphobranchus kaupii]